MWRGSSTSSADEFVELYNDSDFAIDLSGYEVFNEAESKTMLTISEGQIAPYGYFLISNNSKDYKFTKGESILNIDPDIVDTDVSLSNTKFKISLRDQQANILDLAGDGLTPFFGEYNSQIASMERGDYLSAGDLFSSWAATKTSLNIDDGCGDLATPENSGRPIISDLTVEPSGYELETSLEIKLDYRVSDTKNDLDRIEISAGGDLLQAPIDTASFQLGSFDYCPTIQISFWDKTGLSRSITKKLSCYSPIGDVKFNEILFRPKALDWNLDGKLDLKDEWIELKNFDSLDYDLTGYVIEDRSGKQYKLSGKILANSFIFLDGSKTGLSLNDDGESLVFMTPSHKVIDRVDIEKSDLYDISYANFEGIWKFTNKATPLGENIFESGEKTSSEPIVSANSPVVVPSNYLSPEAIAQEGEVVDTIYTVYKTEVSTQPLELPDLVLDQIQVPEVRGVQTKLSINPSKLNQFMLYFFSVLVFILLIFLYEFYRRE